jgi:hypothetical protein
VRRKAVPVADTASNPLGFPAMRGPGHGVWSKAGNHTSDCARVTSYTEVTDYLRVAEQYASPEFMKAPSSRTEDLLAISTSA